MDTARAVVYGAVAALLVGGTYVVSLLVNPDRDCPVCGGRGRHHGLLFTYARRVCTRCHATGKLPRAGTVALRRWRGRHR